MARKTQNQKILTFLASGKQLTVAKAGTLGIRNLSARIDELRKGGFKIYTNKNRLKGGPSRGQKVTMYRLDNADQAYVREVGV